MTLKEIVTLPYPAKISHAIAGVLYYQIIAGDKAIVFPIDMNDRDDVGTTTFLAEYPKPITLMRYIRKAIDSGELVIATTDADSEDEAWEKAYDTVDLGDLEVRDCEYSDDEITLLEE